MVIYTKIAGISFNGRQKFAETCVRNEKLLLVREKDNYYDENAIAIFKSNGQDQLGYVPRYLAVDLAKKMDNGIVLECYVDFVKNSYQTIGIDVRIIEKES